MLSDGWTRKRAESRIVTGIHKKEACGIKSWKTANEILGKIGLARGRVTKGNESFARPVLEDTLCGRGKTNKQWG